MIRIDHHHYLHADESIVGILTQILERINAMAITVDAVVAAVAGLRGDVAALQSTVSLNSTFILALEKTIADLLAGQTLPPDVETALQGVLNDIASLQADTKAAEQAIKDATDNDPSTPVPPSP